MFSFAVAIAEFSSLEKCEKVYAQINVNEIFGSSNIIPG